MRHQSFTRTSVAVASATSRYSHHTTAVLGRMMLLGCYCLLSLLLLVSAQDEPVMAPVTAPTSGGTPTAPTADTGSGGGDDAPTSNGGYVDVTTSTLRDVILSIDEISVFRQALQVTGYLDGILDDPPSSDNNGTYYTVLAPLDEAMDENPFFKMYMHDADANPPLWHEHLNASVRQHMVVGNYTVFDFFNTVGDEVKSMNDPLRISQFLKYIGGAGFVTVNLNCSNGILHLIDRVLEPEFYKDSLANLELQSEFGPDWLNRTSMQTIVDFVDGRDVYKRMNPNGTTHVGCRIRALNTIGLMYLPQTINGAREIKDGEFMNASFKEETRHNLLEYSLLDGMYYYDDIQPLQQDLIMASNNCSHLWITKQKTGKICFNDGCQVSTPDPVNFMRSNGYGYVVDKCIVCSGIAMLVIYASEYTTYNLKDISQFLTASEWNLRNLSMSVGDGGKVTMFAGADDGWNFFNLEDTTRLATEEWKHHQWDLLRHCMVQGEYLVQDLKNMWFNEYNETDFNMTSLAKQNITIGYDKETDTVLVDKGKLWLGDIQGVDGYVHFTDNVPLPQSATHTVYDIAAEIANFSTQVLYIDTVFLTESMRQLLPLTAMYAPNPDWDNKIIKIEDIAKVVLENMMLESLMWCSKLRALKGKRVDSLNGQTWTISLNEDDMPCFETAQTMGGAIYRACITKCDVLARNGIVHELDSIILFETPETLGPMVPTPPFTAVQPNQPTFAQMPSPTPGDVLGGPSFFGPTSPAYSPSEIAASVTSAAGHSNSKAHGVILASIAIVTGMMTFRMAW